MFTVGRAKAIVAAGAGDGNEGRCAASGEDVMGMWQETHSCLGPGGMMVCGGVFDALLVHGRHACSSLA
jgi:hypothetical protein